MLKLLFSGALLSCNMYLSQSSPTRAIFLYDDAGNQIYRGDGLMLRSKSASNTEDSNNIKSVSALMDKKEFWSYIRIYPVPVKDVLTVDWNEEVNDLISEISLYEQNTVHWVFQSKSISTLNKEVKIDMSQKYMGVYILTFVLKDGRRISKNITKL